MTGIECPNCNHEMNVENRENIEIDRCSHCGGIFLDDGEVQELLQDVSGNLEHISLDVAGKIDAFPVRICPKCDGVEMEKVVLLQDSEVILDYCPHCRGYFLDHGELDSMRKELKLLEDDSPVALDTRYSDLFPVRIHKVITSSQIGFREYVNVSVYLPVSLRMGLRLYSERWTDKLAKVLGLFSRQDIETGNPEFDDRFIIQGHDEEQILKKVLTGPVQKMLLDLADNTTIVTNPFTLELRDNAVVCMIGPYSHPVDEDTEWKRGNLIQAMVEIAGEIERNR